MAAFRLMSFNIRGSYVADGANCWEHRAALNVSTIREAAPDLIGFQEVQMGNLAVYERELPEYEFLLGPKYNNRPPYCYLSVFWRPEKFKKLASGEFWLSTTPERHSGSWDTNCFRAAHWVRLRCLADGHEFFFVNTHLDHISELARVEGSRVILEQLPGFISPQAPVIVAGDFNCNPGSDAYAQFMKQGFIDTFHVTGGVDAPHVFTFHEFKGKCNGQDVRIDWILTRNGGPKFQTSKHQIIITSKPPLYPSDHYPLLAEIELG